VATIYTIGHSTRDLADFSRVLQAHELNVLADIRAFPMSRRHPQYNREALELWLPEIGLEYRWVQALGGRRKKIMDESPNVALRNDSLHIDNEKPPRAHQLMKEARIIEGRLIYKGDRLF
jgi:uncharacterized protein (DUF488 family)